MAFLARVDCDRGAGERMEPDRAVFDD